MTIAEAIRKFEQLARLHPYLVLIEEQRAHRMLQMFQPKIALEIKSAGGQPTTTIECIEREYQAKHQLNQIKEKRAKAHKREENMIGKLTPMPIKYRVRVTDNKRRGRETFLK